MSTRAGLRLLSLAILTMVAGVMIYAGLLQRGPGQSASNRQIGAPSPPSRGTQAVPLSLSGGAVQDLVALADEGVVTGVDPETGRLRYRLVYEALDPGERGLFLLTRPRATIFQRDRVIEISADSGRLLWPSREREPESGHFEGNVVISMRDSDPGAPGETGAEIATVRTDAMSFDTTFGEVRSEASVSIDGPGLRVTGEGMSLRVSEDRARPLAFLRVERNGALHYDPSTARIAGEEPASREKPRETRGEQPAEARIGYYRAKADGGVRASVGDRELIGEEVLVWARLDDGRLVLDLDASTGDDPASPDGTSEARDQHGSSQEVRMNWGGALEIRAVLDRPAELRRDQVFARVQSPGGTAVVIEDKSGGGSVRCVTLEYAATRRALVLFGVGPIGVSLSVPDLFELLSGRAEMDLTTGIGAAPGPGLARAIGAARSDESSHGPTDRTDPRHQREVRWLGRADFRVDTSHGPIGSGGEIRPEEVSFTGAVEARDGDASISGEYARLVLDTVSDPPGAQARVHLRRLFVEGDALARDARDAMIAADALDVLFVSSEDGSPVPSIATAQGNVRAERGGESLRAGLAEARLVRDEEGRTLVESLDARLGAEVRIVRETDSEARVREVIETSSDRLNMSERGGVIDLLGSPALISRSSGTETASVSGQSMRINASEAVSGLTVFGPGSATYSTRRPDSQASYDRMQIDWNSGVVFDDLIGRAEVMGDVVASAELGEDERHVVRGDRLTLTLSEADAGDRALRTAVVEGSEAGPARVELRRYRAATDGAVLPTLDSLLYVEGRVVEYDARASTVRIPGPGLLLVEDRRDAAAPAPDRSDRIARGTTLMTWQNSMTVDRRAGEGRMEGDVTIRHRHAGDDRPIEIDCQAVTAWFSESRSSDDRPGSQAVTLSRVEATGGVLATQGDRQLICDRLVYDEPSGTLRAFAEAGNRVTVYDEAKGQHFVASSVEIDLARDEVRVLEGSTLSPVR